jgi:hypothetical protein
MKLQTLVFVLALGSSCAGFGSEAASLSPVNPAAFDAVVEYALSGKNIFLRETVTTLEKGLKAAQPSFSPEEYDEYKHVIENCASCPFPIELRDTMVLDEGLKELAFLAEDISEEELRACAYIPYLDYHKSEVSSDADGEVVYTKMAVAILISHIKSVASGGAGVSFFYEEPVPPVPPVEAKVPAVTRVKKSAQQQKSQSTKMLLEKLVSVVASNAKTACVKALIAHLIATYDGLELTEESLASINDFKGLIGDLSVVSRHIELASRIVGNSYQEEKTVAQSILQGLQAILLTKFAQPAAGTPGSAPKRGVKRKLVDGGINVSAELQDLSKVLLPLCLDSKSAKARIKSNIRKGLPYSQLVDETLPPLDFSSFDKIFRCSFASLRESLNRNSDKWQAQLERAIPKDSEKRTDLLLTIILLHKYYVSRKYVF